ncbi:MAG: AAA family ATPase [Chlorobiaceae bacterium]|nr:AAA family ATPase [Chlorobiaceae bacterium]
MKILLLRFKNLNSLQGEWSIDFTRPEYVSDGIFAITGPTGSGKSTILDAICLALYGQTPRLGKITKSSNELMSRHTGECFAEVTFSTSAGTYCCHWSQHRSRRRPEGDLQAQKHEISDVATARPIHSKVQDTLQAIEELTGMDFDRFTRSMLLAQGGFAAFLQADPDRRAPVLEQITGTEIYSKISMKVHERQRAERMKLDLLQAESDAVRLLGDEELERLKADHAGNLEIEQKLASQAEEASVALRWLQEIDRLEKELAGLDIEALALDVEREAFRPEKVRLALAGNAAALEHLFTPLQMQRGELQRDLGELSARQSRRPAMEALLKETESRFETSDAELGREIESAAAARPIIARVRLLDARISEKLRACDIRKHELEALEQRHRQLESRRTETAAAIESTRVEVQQLRSWQDENRADSALVAGLSGIQHALEELHPALKREAVAAAGVEAARQALQKLQDDTAAFEPEAALSRSKLNGTRKVVDELRASLLLHLGGSSLKSLRIELDALKERRRMLGEIAALYVSGKELAPKIAGISAGIQALEARQADSDALLEQVRQLLAMAEREVVLQEERRMLAARVRSLEQERDRLTEGLPCPLCGSTDHPYAESATSLPDADDQQLQRAKQVQQEHAVALKNLEISVAGYGKEIEQKEQLRNELAEMRGKQVDRCLELLVAAGITVPARNAEPVVLERLGAVEGSIGELARRIETLETIEEQMNLAETELQQRLEASNACERRLELADQTLRSLKGDLLRLEQEHEATSSERNARRSSLIGMMEPYFAAGHDKSDPDALVESLAARGALWQKQVDRGRSLEQLLNTNEAGLKSLEAQKQTLEKDLVVLRNAVSAAADEIETDRTGRIHLFDAKDPDVEEQRLEGLVQKAREQLEEAGNARAQARNESAVFDRALQDLQRSIEGRREILDGLEKAFVRELLQKGFADEAAFIAARIPEMERDRMEQVSAGLDRRGIDLESRRSDRAGRLLEEVGRRLTTMPYDELAAQIDQLQDRLRNVRGDIGATIRQLDENERAAGERRQMAESVEAQRSECRGWDILHDLIGSADGKKFRNFAQGLTFDIMIAHANRQLVRMTERYVLVRDQSEPLELSVVDQWQAGEVRSTRNLSGGESFIVSLALALGLSQMSSRNVRVDSLFLDEGFGTLDEEALETALETLSGLQQTGKLIGIISHVPALKERIATRIRVAPLTGGRSTLEGPGVVGPLCSR